VSAASAARAAAKTFERRRPGYRAAMTLGQQYDQDFAIWSAARAEANLAYDTWCAAPGRDSYAVYRAAEDRADAAEDALFAVPAAPGLVAA
jgi:hypothetical protein